MFYRLEREIETLVLSFADPVKNVWADGGEDQELQDGAVRRPLSQHQPDA